MKKTLQEYALIAEIVGAVAVVVSLVYVGLSVQQNTKAIQVANHQALVAMDLDKNSWLRDSEFAAIYEKARQDMDTLSLAESRQYLTFVADTMNAWEFAFITHNNGAIDETIWNGWDIFYRTEMSTNGFQQFWKDKPTFSSDFVVYVNSVMTAAGQSNDGVFIESF